MDNVALLRLEKIKLSLQAAAKNAEIQSQQNVAILAVALPVGAGAAIGGFGGQLPWWVALPVVLGSGIIVVSQVRGMRDASMSLTKAQAEANDAIDDLMWAEGESDDDEPPTANS